MSKFFPGKLVIWNSFYWEWQLVKVLQWAPPVHRDKRYFISRLDSLNVLGGEMVLESAIYLFSEFWVFNHTHILILKTMKNKLKLTLVLQLVTQNRNYGEIKFNSLIKFLEVSLISDLYGLYIVQFWQTIIIALKIDNWFIWV